MNADLLRKLGHMRSLATWHAHQATLDAAISRLSVAQGQGFVMVPRVPTYEMLCAGDVAAGRGNGRLTLPIYTAMLAAAPAQPDGVES